MTSQANGQTNGKHSKGRPDKQMVGLMTKQFERQPDKQMVEPTTKQLVGQPNKQIVGPMTKWSDHFVDSA